MYFSVCFACALVFRRFESAGQITIVVPGKFYFLYFDLASD